MKFYIGIHSTNDLNDGYLGSGYLLKRAIKKHGIDNFEREILYTFETRELALKKEMELVDLRVIKSNLNYNMAIGGNGGVYSTLLTTKKSNDLVINNIKKVFIKLYKRTPTESEIEKSITELNKFSLAIYDEIIDKIGAEVCKLLPPKNNQISTNG